MQKGRDFIKAIRRSFFTLHSNTSISQMDQSTRYRYSPTLKWNPMVEEYFIKTYGADHFSRISTALTRPSCYSCIRVNTLKSTSDAVIEKLLEIFKERGMHDVAVQESSTTWEPDNCCKATSKCTGSAESLKAIKSISKCQFPGLDYVVFVEGSGPHAIHYGDDEGKPLKEVIVSRKCAEAVLRGAQVYVPGVLACSAHVERGDAVAVSVAVEQYGPDGGWGVAMTRGTVLQGSQEDPYYFERDGFYIGQATAMMSRAGMFRVTEGVAVDMKERVYRLPSFYDLLEGEIFLQNLPSIITAHALDPQAGERILDMCAAPGGKTTAIASLMKDKGEVVAVDRSHNKVLGIQKLAAEMGLSCITTYKLDALKSVCNGAESDSLPNTSSAEDARTPDLLSTGIDGFDAKLLFEKNFNDLQLKDGQYPSKAELRKRIRQLKNGPGRNHTAGGRVEKSKGFSPNSFDRVLLDAPCSALGLRPRLFAGEDTIDSLRSNAKYQRRMFDQAVQLVRPGGVIVYSTCTINPGENEALVRYALDKYEFLSLASQHPKIGGPGLTGSCQLSDGFVEEWLRPGEENLVQRFDPSSDLDTIGFFIAKFSVGPKNI
ncbi:rRNA (cytosine-C(5))-methyltransferase NOP2C isoform X1 [Solanum verrucosum]|uniref:rRNA (cytosine-C(5))-methyltransferase NOP2C isoform X1 n=1 Tax=Solanum verrucosum TaxID=315347 RepID=UPI0020D1AF18|nr:rRNA (cytosine-C(5))-methyltransferase NOP2C isoform X1 [Solanum verrucosum]